MATPAHQVRYVLLSRQSKDHPQTSDLAELRRFAAQRGLTVVHEISEVRQPNSRVLPGLAQALQLVRAGTADGLLCSRGVRHTRSFEQAAELLGLVQVGKLGSLMTPTGELTPLTLESRHRQLSKALDLRLTLLLSADRLR